MCDWCYCCFHQVQVNWKLAWRGNTADGRTSVGGRDCSEDVIANRDLMGQAFPWRCLSDNCGQERISTMQYHCTSFSPRDEENWSMGVNSLEYDFPIATDKIFTLG